MNLNEVTQVLKPLYLPENKSLDSKQKIQSLSEIDTITDPYVGLLFFSEQEDTYYKVNSLKEGYLIYTTNEISSTRPSGNEYETYEIIPNKLVGTYEELTETIKPEIINGEWYIGGVATGIVAEGVNGAPGIVPTPLYLSDPLPTIDGLYQPIEEGLYTNNLEFDGSEGLTYFLLQGGSWTKIVYPVSFVPTGLVAENNPDAVSGGEVWNKTIKVEDISFRNMQLFDKVKHVGGYINSSGAVVTLANTSYGVISNLDSSIDSNITVSIPNLGGNNRYVVFRDGAGSNVGAAILIGQSNLVTLSIPSTAYELLFTIDQPNSPGVVDVNLIESYYGTEIPLEPNSFVDEIKGVGLRAKQIEATDQVKAVIKDNGILQYLEKSYNVVNPANSHENSNYTAAGYIYSSVYHATGFLILEKNVTYYTATVNGINLPIRTWRELDAAGNVLASGTAGSYNSITITNPNAVYTVILFYNTVPVSGFCLTKENPAIFQPYDLVRSLESEDVSGLNTPDSVVTRAAMEAYLADSGSAAATIITLKNSDKVLYTGSSSIESYYSPDRKSFVNKLQDFLDIAIVPYGWSGEGADDIANRFIADTPARIADGVRPSEINPTIVFVGQTLNSRDLIDDPTDEAFMAGNERLLRAAVSVTGAKPIIGTAYRTENRVWIENSLKLLADKWGADFVPFGTYHMSMIRTGKVACFYGQGHPAIRTHEAYTLPLLSYFNQLKRPKQGILFFEARNQSESVANLVYKDSMQRAEKFRSIQVGEIAIRSDQQHMYDRLDETYSVDKINASQYLQMLKGDQVQFGNTVLIEAILPKVRASRISIDIEMEGVTNKYIFNNLTSTWSVVSDLEITNPAFVEFDKVKILLVGSNIKIKNPSVTVLGGVEKPSQAHDRVLPPAAGKHILGGLGFDATTLADFVLRDNPVHNITTKYGDALLNDMPFYLGESKDIVTLTETLFRNFNLTDIKSFGYRKLRVWTCARLNPKIYNPVAFAAWQGAENPYTDVSWYSENKYDYEDMHIILKYNFGAYQIQCRSINRQKVGLFWNLGYVDILMPVAEDGNYQLQFSRGTNNNPGYPMELCDVRVELLD